MWGVDAQLTFETSAQHGSLRGAASTVLRNERIYLRDRGDQHRGDRLFTADTEPTLSVGAHVLDDRK